jgi:NADPH-dependent glutamate synthase beta subunit-like oxidoreductase/dihydroorotate dehydrogenase
MVKDIIIPVTIGGVTFKNPFFVASGPTTKNVRQLLRIEETGWAGASIKLSIDPAPYINRKPRYGIFEDRNALAFTTEKRLTFMEGLKLIEEAKKVLTDLKLMANITYAGDNGIDGWVNMAQKFEEAGADIIELNMCCPNMSYNLELTSGGNASTAKKTGASMGQQSDIAAEIAKAVKESIHIPLFVKLTPEGGQIAKVAQALYAVGTDAVGSAGNRMGIPPINLEEPNSSFFHLQDEISMSCHCGSWLKPLAQRDTYEIRKVCGEEPFIMATGGITNWKDAVEMVLCGGNLLGICAETLVNGYDIVRPMIAGMKSYMDEHGYKTMDDFRSKIVPEVKTATEVTLHSGYAKIMKPNLSAPCKVACPHHVPAQAYIQKVAKGEFKEAYELITSKNPLQGICGFVCSHPCEDACTRGINGRPVQIRDIKRFVLEYGKAKGWKPNVMIATDNGHKAAVIGSGPAGLSCAAELKKAGYRVTVFEREDRLGGMLACGIPKFRLAQDALKEEIEAIRSMGVIFDTGKELGKEITISSLKEAGFEAVFLGVGAQAANKLGIEGEDAEGTLSANELLQCVSREENISLGKTVVVYGNNFAAIDSARTAVRLGAEKVFLAYKTIPSKRLAIIESMKEAEDEGVKTINDVDLKLIKTANGKVAGLELVNYLGISMYLPCETVILGHGTHAELDKFDNIASLKGFVKIDSKTGATDVEGVFAGGDAVRNANIITAIAAGKRAAVSMDQFILGEAAVLRYTDSVVCVNTDQVLQRVGYFKEEGAAILTYNKDAKERSLSFATYTRAFTEDEAVKEASRCLNCGCGEGCQLCKTICCDFAPFISDTDTLRIDQDACVACGMCYNRCPNKNIEMVNTGKNV